MNSKFYKCCAVPHCPSSSFKTPEKLFVYVPRYEIRDKWLRLAGKDPARYSKTSKMHFCEDHFDMSKDMENYTEYRLLGAVSQVRMREGCLPTKFECQPDRPSNSCIENTTRPLAVKRPIVETESECDQDIVSVWVKPELVVEDVAEEDEDVTSQNSLSEELENNTSDSVPQTPAYNYNQCEVPPPGVATAEEDIGKHETVDHPHHHHPNNHNPLYPKSLHPLYPKSLHPLHPKSLHPLHPNHHLPPPPAADVPHLPTVNGTDLSPPPMLPSILPGGFKGEGEETRNLSDQQLQRLVLLEQLSYYRKAQMLVDFQMKRELSRNFNL